MPLEPRTYNLKANGGFMALMSAIIISVILLLIAVSLSTTSFYGRTNILDFELKEKSSALAEACADTAILRLALDPNYPFPVNDPINVGENDCIIQSVSGDTQKTVKVKANYLNYVTNLEIKVNSNMSVVFWKEI